MNHIKIGANVKQKQGFDAFIPYPLPPKEDFHFDPKILKKDNEATRLLGKLNGITKLLPDSDFFLLMYLRKDAASSSQLEQLRKDKAEKRGGFKEKIILDEAKK